MSSPASRRRQRQRRRARERLWAAQSLLGERAKLAAAYERVVEDMSRRYADRMPSMLLGAQAIGLVAQIGHEAKTECEQLQALIADLEARCEELEPPASDPEETINP